MTVDRRDGIAFDIQFNHGWVDFSHLVDLAHLAEAAGFDTLWVADHLSGRSMNAPSMPECFVTLGGLAAVTSTIGLGSLVANAQVRNPALLANAAATVQMVSGGRFTFGIGAGASPASGFAEELHASGIEIPHTMGKRHEHLLETIATIRTMWSDDRPSRYEGFPRPTTSPRVIVGVNSPELAGLAAKNADGVNVRASHPRLAEIIAAIDGRVETSVWVPFEIELLDPSCSRVIAWGEAGVRRVILVMTGKPEPSALDGLRVR